VLGSRRARGDTRYIGKTVQFSRTAEEAPAQASRRSLKTQQHARAPTPSGMRLCFLAKLKRVPGFLAKPSECACGQTRSTSLGPGRSSHHGMRHEAGQVLQSWRLP